PHPAGPAKPTPDDGSADPLVSVVVATLNEAQALPGLLDHLAALGGRIEVVVADGASADGTAALARADTLRPAVVETPPGRAHQLNMGAAASRGEVLVFLHADSRLPPEAYRSLAGVSRDDGVVGGNFRLRFEGADLFARALAAFYQLLRRRGIYYGDSSIFVRREVFERLGGFSDQPIMDDYDFARRLERAGRTVCVPGPALTSSRRWRRSGIPRTVAAWVAIQLLYWAGVPARWLAPLYRRAR
ncbi:MAG: TIGR04283 family arsenosugar biosynthesis glycosyltransferase, partial [Actinobacteria bacterium]|nr:TIGR04283 family arsenosugar biosynthesis glycosyltransferase [Actinomycetota bacterium]